MNTENLKFLNESDVEQKLVQPLLIASNPEGLGYNLSDFRTKADLRKIEIDKGNASKLYYPDYIILLQGLPVLVVEVKHPNENDLSQALREARLYANELNAMFPTGVNPCRKILVTNGLKMQAAYNDSNNVEIEVDIASFDIANSDFYNLLEFASKSVLVDFSRNIYSKIRGNAHYSKPANVLGGKTIQNEELPENSFGSNLSLDLRHLFNPENAQERIDLVKNAYVSSRKRIKHVSPIDKIIRSAKVPTLVPINELKDTGRPKEIIDKLSQAKTLSNRLLLLVGSVGSGKTTFTDYLREVALSNELKKSTYWVSINLNDAPVSKEMIYSWVCERVFESIKTSNPDVDFASLEVIKKIYSREIKEFERGEASLLGVGSEGYNAELYQYLKNLKLDYQKSLHNYLRCFCLDKGKFPIIILDNSDKRNREEQLLMFQVANWLKNTYPILVFLPIRDTTYDLHRKEPPLDTVVKDMVFRIDPPLFETVLYKRFDYAVRQLKGSKESLFYYLPNSIRVDYTREEQLQYLACILKSLFQNNFFKRLIAGLAGRNIRLGMELFLDFCKSGYINEKEIYKMRMQGGDYLLPNHLISRVFLRGNRKIYSDSNSRIKNLFHSEAKDIVPNPFTRIAILRWLKDRYRLHGPSHIMGFHKVVELLSGLIPLGFDEERVITELSVLIKAGLIQSETKSDKINLEDLICITPSGFIHLELLTNVDYLAACSEDVWFRNKEIANSIAKKISGKSNLLPTSIKVQTENARQLLDYVKKFSEENLAIPDKILKQDHFETLFDLDDSFSSVEKKEKVIANKVVVSPLNQFPIGSCYNGLVVSIKEYGLFVDIGLNAIGLLHISNMGDKKMSAAILEETYEEGDWIDVEVTGYNEEHERLQLKIA